MKDWIKKGQMSVKVFLEFKTKHDYTFNSEELTEFENLVNTDKCHISLDHKELDESGNISYIYKIHTGNKWDQIAFYKIKKSAGKNSVYIGQPERIRYSRNWSNI